MATIADIRKKYPQYNDLSDQQLAEGLHRKFYSDLPFDDFAQRIGLQKRTVAGQVGETLKGVGRGFAGAFLSAGEGLAELADAATNVVGLEGLIDSGDENELVKASRAGRDWINNSFLGADPSYQDAWWTKFGEGVGSMASFLTPAAALRGLGAAGKATRLGMGRNELAAAATLAGGAGAGDQAQRIAAARAQGIEVGEGQEDAAIALGGLIGLSEIAPIAQILKRVPKNITPAEKYRIMDLLQRSIRGGAEEAVQESVAGLLQDFTEKGIYNENLPIGQSFWDDLTVGGAVGAFTEFVVNAAAGRRSFITTDAQREYEAKLRERREANIQKIQQALADTEQRRATRQADPAGFVRAAEAAQANAANIAAPQFDGPDIAAGEAYARTIANELGDFFPTNVKFEVKEAPPTVTSRGTLPNGETIVEQTPNFIVVDSNGKQYGQAVQSREQAAGLAYGLNNEVIDSQVRGQVLNILENSGESYSPEAAATLMRYGYQILNPEANMITSAALNEAAGTTVDKGYIENYSFQTILDGEQVKEDGKTVGYKIQGPNGTTVVPGLTLSQQINQKRKEQGLPETQVFTIDEARDALGNKFENLTNINVLAVPDGMTYTASIVPTQIEVSKGKFKTVNIPSVVSSAGEVIQTRFATQEDSDASGKKEDGSPNIKVGQKIELKSLEDAQAFAERKNREAARGQGLSVQEVNALMKGEKNFSQEINRLLKSKNIGSETNSPEVKALFKSIIGKESISDMTSGEQRLLYARLRNLPTFEGTVKLPLFEAKPYTRDNFLRASKFIQDANALDQSVTDEQIAEAAGLLPEDARKDLKVQALKKDLASQGVQLKPAKRPAVTRETVGGIPIEIPLALPAPTAGATDTYNFLREELRKKMKGFGLEDIATRIDETLLNFADPVRYMEEMGSETEGYYNPFLREIVLAVDRVDPQKTLTPEQRLNALIDVLNHEVVHAAREMDLWKAEEWDTLSNAAARVKRLDSKGNRTNETYLQWARRTYADQSPLIQEEEAVADINRQVKQFGDKAVSGKPKVLINRMTNFFERLDNSFRGAGFQSYTDILNRLESGEVGGRTRGEIRTLRETEAEMADQGILPERFADYQPIIASPVLRNQEREERKVQVQQKAQTSGVTDFNPAALEGAAIRESRSSIEKVPEAIEVKGRLRPTKDSQGLIIYSGYEGPEVFGIQTAPTAQGLQNFWRWFGDSKAVSRDGRPLVYYHGTGQDITAFRPKQAGSVFITRSPTFAEEFAFLSDSYMVGNFTDFMTDQEVLNVLDETLQVPSAFAPKVYDKVEKLRNSVAKSVAANRPLRVETIKDLKEIASQGRSSRFLNAIQARMPSAANVMPVYVKAENPFDYQEPDHIKRVLKRVKDISPVDLDSGDIERLKKGDWRTIEGTEDNSPILDAIRDLGFDSMYVEEAGQKNLAVFDPNQVKSAIGNNGYFSLTPSIRESRVRNPQIDTPEFQQAFRGSKAVDEAGEPQIFYHGATRDIDVFRPKPGNKLIFTSPDPDFASRFAANNMAFFVPSPEWGPQDVDWAERQIANAQFGDRTRAPTVYPLYVIAKNPFDFQNKSHIAQLEKDLPKFLSRSTPSRGPYTRAERKKIIDEIKKGRWGYIEEVAENTDFFERSGYDSIYVEEAGVRNLAVFSPNQLKSAVGNVGTFDITRPSIRESRQPTYNIVNTRTGQVVGQANTINGARRSVDRRDNQYGAAVHTIQVVDEERNLEERNKARESLGLPALREARREEPKVIVSGPPIPESIDDVSSLESASRFATSKFFSGNRLFKQELQDRVLAAAKAEKVDITNLDDPEVIKYLVRVGVKDAMRAMETNKNAIGWYDRKVRAALNILSKIHPELATDENSKFAFVYALAVTSNGMKVNRNFELAEQAYNHFKRTGEMPTNIGEGQAADIIDNSMALFNRLKKSMTMEAMRKTMLTDFKVGILNRMGFDVSGELADTDVRGAAIIGPKIGNGFFSNLYGIFDALTMDRWLMRTWGRWTGTLITQKPELLASQGIALENAIEALRKNKEVFENLQQIIGLRIPPVPKDEIERNGWLALVSNAINRASVDPENRAQINSLPNGERIRKDGNNYSKTLDGQNEAPANGTQRNQIRGVFNQILSELRKQNPELTMSDLQALLWYPEKRLYDTSKSKDDAQLESYEDEDAPDYANAAAVLARKNGVPDKEIKDAIAQAETDSARVRAETAGRGSIEQQAVATAGQRPQGLSAAKRKRFIAQSILARIRSNRSSNGTASEPYQRASGKNGKSVRLLGLRTPVLGKYLPARVFGNDLKAMDQNPVKFSELDSRNGGNALFHKAITEFKNSNPDAASVYVYPESDYSDMRLFLSESGKTGVAIKPDGDIVSVFSNERAGRSAMEIAIQMGGRKLDAFDTVLPNFYKAHGFSEVARLNWDDSQAPADWNKKKFSDFNNGEPDVVFMVYDPNGFITQDTAPVFTDYGEALDAQTEAVKNISPPISDGQMQESPEEIQAEESEVRPRSQSQLDEAVVKAEEDIANTPVGSIPLYDLNASPDALYVAQNPDAGEQLNAEEFVRYSRRNEPIYSPGIDQIIGKLAAEPPNQTPGQTIVQGLALPPYRDLIDRFRKAFVFNYSRLEYYTQRHPSLMHNTADSSALAGAEFADRNKAFTAAAIKHGVPVYRNGIVKIEDFVHNGRRYRGLAEVMVPLFSKEHGNLEKLAQSYAIALRGRRLVAEGKLAPALDPAEFARLEAEVARFVNPNTGNPIIKEWYDAWQAYNGYVIQFLRDTGMIDDAGAQLWAQQSDYIPFYRETKGGSVAHPKIFGGLTSTTHMKAVGKSSEAIDMPLLEAILTNLDAAIAMGMKNVAQQRIVRDMIQIGLGRMVRPGEATEGLPTVTFKVQGKKYTAIIDDPLIFESMQALPEIGLSGVLETVFRAPANLLREMITREPGYMLANIMRDTASVTFTSQASLGSMIDAVRSFSQGFEQLERGGAIGGYDFARDPENMTEFLAKEAKKMGHEIPEYGSTLGNISRSKYLKPFTWIWDAAGRMSDKAEALNRIRVYEDTLKRTGNEAEAFYQALSVINYGRRGRSPLIRVLTAVVPFLNARIQGLDKLYQAGTGQFGPTTNRRKNAINFAARASLMVGLTMLYYNMVSDDDEYKNANAEALDNYYIFPTAFGFAIRIPIPFEVGLLFKTIPERAMRLADGTDTFRDARQAATRAVTSTLAFNPIPQAVLPIAEIYANYDTFTGRSVVPPYMDSRMAAEYQARFGTNELARILGEATGISPIKIDHLLNGYFGSIGTYTLDAIDTVLRDNDRAYPTRNMYEYPFIRRFFTDANQPGLQSQFYDLYREVDKVTNTIRQLKEDGRTDELNAYIMENQNLLDVRRNVNQLNKIMKRYRDQKDAVLKSPLDPEVKKEIVDQLDASINTTLQVMPILRRAAFGEPE
jgi:hypothetical protein